MPDKYAERMARADALQKAGTELMKVGCGITVLVLMALFLLFVLVIVIGSM